MIFDATPNLFGFRFQSYLETVFWKEGQAYPGAKRAADEFFADKAEPVLMLTTGQALVIKR